MVLRTCKSIESVNRLDSLADFFRIKSLTNSIYWSYNSNLDLWVCFCWKFLLKSITKNKKTLRFLLSHSICSPFFNEDGIHLSVAIQENQQNLSFVFQFRSCCSIGLAGYKFYFMYCSNFNGKKFLKSVFWFVHWLVSLS